MTNEQILEKAIEKAVHNGYEPEPKWALHLKRWAKDPDSFALCSDECFYYGIVFSHDFAKAIWGMGMISSCCEVSISRTTAEIIKMFGKDHESNMFYCSKCENMIVEEVYATNAWQYHLQQMVLEEEPLKYLEKFL